MYFFTKIETNAIARIIAKEIKCLLNQYDEDYHKKLVFLLKFLPIPPTNVESDNINWKKMVILILIIYGSFVLLSSFLIAFFFKEVSITEIFIKNIIIFGIIGYIEYVFFINVAINYTDVSIEDIKEATLETLKTGKVLYNF